MNNWRISNFQQYQEAYKQSQENPEQFWKAIAETFSWHQKFKTTKSGGYKNLDFKWFEEGKLNITENCLDRHLKTSPDKLAIIFEPNHPNEKAKKYTYRQLHQAVCKTANMLKELQAQKGDRICLYMSMVPELLISVLACARIGAIHSVVFGGFSAQSLADRIQDCGAKILITNDGGYRGSKIIPLKNIADQALNHCPTIQKVLVHKRVNNTIEMKKNRDIFWQDLYSKQDDRCDPTSMQAEDPLFILYTSGSTGKPKGLMHTTAGYMVWASYTFENVFQVEPQDIYWCSADIGWVTGHTYMTYGPLLSGTTTLIFEGIPTHPDASRFWQVIDKHKVTHFYTAPTAIRALMAQDQKFVTQASLETLKVLGTVGEPINVEVWQWYNNYVGKNRCPIVDTWWQTETGGIMIAPLAGITKTKPGFATLPLPGVFPEIIDNHLCISTHWPGQARSIWGDHQRFRETYFNTYTHKYFTGDGCRQDQEGNYRITGRVDDVINVSGHRIGTAEVEDAIDLMDNVIETAVVGFPHKIKGQGIYAYIITQQSDLDLEKFNQAVCSHITKAIGPIAKPDKIQVVSALPKTRSGKIMRRILRKIAEGNADALGDTSTLLDPSIIDEIIKGTR